MDVESEQYWSSTHKIRQNDTINVWNKESKCIYKELIDNTYGNMNNCIEGEF